MALLIRNAAEVICVAAQGERCKAGAAMAEVVRLYDASVLVEGDKIAWVGLLERTPKLPPDTQILDAAGMVVLPGLIDSHTHLVFAGDRADEFERRIQGATYQQIAAAGGGINTTVQAVRAASKEELKEATRLRLARMLRLGVTTVEIKSGYGLSLEAERKCLEVVAELAQEQPCELVPTFMGAHEVPPEYKHHRKEYLRIVREEMIPEIARLRLAEFCDVFCEKDVFSVAEAEEVLQAGLAHGLKPKIHAEEFIRTGGALLAARIKAASADHLLKITDDDLIQLGRGTTIATLLPGTALFLRLPFAPARRMIQAGVPLALATDCNPGSCMTENLPLIGALACMQMQMTPAEVVTALTLNAAAAVCRSDRLGSIEVGKQADLIVCDVPDYRHLFYHFGVNHVRYVVKSGRVVVAPGAGA